MSKLTWLNGICGVLLLLSFGAGVLNLLSTQQEYGWVHERTITINGVSFVEVVDLSQHLISVVLIMGMGVLFMFNVLIFKAPLLLLASNYNFSGNIMLYGEPESWNIETDPSGNTFKVTLGEYAVSFGRDLLEDRN